MIQYEKLEIGEWFQLPEDYEWYINEYFMTFEPPVVSFEEFQLRLQDGFNFKEDEHIKIVYHNYDNFGILRKK